MKDATMITIAGYGMATIVVVCLLLTDGATAAAAALGVVGVGAGLGQYVGTKAAKGS